MLNILNASVSHKIMLINEGIAQSGLEHLAFNQGGAGSNPAAFTLLKYVVNLKYTANEDIILVKLLLKRRLGLRRGRFIWLLSQTYQKNGLFSPATPKE